ncbi:hypothetical protein [Hymenobacter terricola]|uniref:hypothetical protein n=1 Tax=Hymenobacter terricola TaxID=2819236 RepID=UPI001B313F8A|nr:hypothetical protein [Hymenobacter terricola]
MNPASLANLVGGRKAIKTDTELKPYQKNIIKFLNKNQKAFLARLSLLSDKDFAEMYLQLLTLIASTDSE